VVVVNLMKIVGAVLLVAVIVLIVLMFYYRPTFEYVN